MAWSELFAQIHGINNVRASPEMVILIETRDFIGKIRGFLAHLGRK